MFHALVLLALWAPAHAVDRSEAEHLRLSGELDQLSQRQLWSGVNRKFAELEKLGVELTYDDLLHGAHAARALGDMSAAYSRLKRASRLDSTKEVIDWLYAIDMNYGSVELLRNPKKGDLLSAAEMPFDPDQRAAVDLAVATVADSGTFSGMLPRGAYTFAGQDFSVQPGIGLRIEVSPKMKKTQGIVVNVQATPTWGSGGEAGTAAVPPGSSTEPPPTEQPKP
jgi:hypothetical protein